MKHSIENGLYWKTLGINYVQVKTKDMDPHRYLILDWTLGLLAFAKENVAKHWMC